MIPLNLPQRNYIKGLWHLDEVSGIRYDSSGHSNTLQDNNTVLYGTGKIGNAADFELATSEYLSITDALQTGLDITGEITICAWIKLETLPAVTNYIVTKYKTDGDLRCYSFQVMDTNYKPRFTLSPAGGAGTTVTGDTALSTGSWFHLTATLNQVDDKMRIYKDGELDCTPTAYTTDIADKAAPFCLGCMVTTVPAQFFDGLIDEVIVWNTCLTAAEVLQVKNITAYNYSAGLGIGNPYIF